MNEIKKETYLKCNVEIYSQHEYFVEVECYDGKIGSFFCDSLDNIGIFIEEIDGQAYIPIEVIDTKKDMALICLPQRIIEFENTILVKSDNIIWR